MINSYIGIRQELKAKRTLDELAVLVAPQAKVLRDGALVALRAEEVVPGDVIAVEPGDQLVADGEVIASRGMTLDESMLTGEADGVRKGPGDRALSGSFCISGSGRYVVDAVREESYAGKLAGEARAFRHPPSPLQAEVNQVIVACLYVMVPLAVVLLLTLKLRSTDITEAAQTATAGLVTLIPEGLVLLMSVTFAVAAVRLAHRKTLVQQMSATESLASVDTICVDKTGHPDRRRAAAARGRGRRGGRGGGRPRGAGALRGQRRRPQPHPGGDRRALPRRGRAGSAAKCPFSSEWKWSGLRIGGTSYVMGAPDVLERAGALTLPAGPAPGARARKPRPAGGSSPSASRPRRCPPSRRATAPPRAARRWPWSCSKRRCAPTPRRRSPSCASRKST